MVSDLDHDGGAEALLPMRWVSGYRFHVSGLESPLRPLDAVNDSSTLEVCHRFHTPGGTVSRRFEAAEWR